MKRWQYGVAEVTDHGIDHGPIEAVDTEDDARRITVQGYPFVLLFRRPMPKPWRLVPYIPRAGVIGLMVVALLATACSAAQASLVPYRPTTTASTATHQSSAHATSLTINARSALPTAHHSAFPGAVRLPSGDLLVVWRQATTHMSIDGQIWGSTSSDNGQTWSPATKRLAWTGYDLRDPALALIDGVLYMSFCDSLPGRYGIGVYIARSTDGGVSWFTKARLDPRWPRAGESGPVVKVGGRLLQMFYGHPAGETRGSVWAAWSSDQGTTWTAPERVLNGTKDGRDYEEPWATVTSSGLVRVYFRWGLVDRVGSVDYNGTWTNAHPLWAGSGRPSCVVNGARVLCVYRALDPAYLNRPALMRLSTDGGDTFGAPVILDGRNAMFTYAQPVTSGSGWVVAYAIQTGATTTSTLSNVYARGVG